MLTWVKSTAGFLGLVYLATGCELLSPESKSHKKGPPSQYVVGDLRLERTPAGRSILVRFQTNQPCQCEIKFRVLGSNTAFKTTNACEENPSGRTQFGLLVEPILPTARYQVELTLWPVANPDGKEVLLLDELPQHTSTATMVAKLDLTSGLGSLHQAGAGIPTHTRQAKTGCFDGRPDRISIGYDVPAVANLGVDRLAARGFFETTAYHHPDHPQSFLYEFQKVRASDRLTWFFRFHGRAQELITQPPIALQTVKLHSPGSASIDVPKGTSQQTAQIKSNQPVTIDWTTSRPVDQGVMWLQLSSQNKTIHCFADPNNQSSVVTKEWVAKLGKTDRADLFVAMSSQQVHFAHEGLPVHWVVDSIDWRYSSLKFAEL